MSEAKQLTRVLLDTLTNGHVPAAYGEFTPLVQEIKERFDEGGADAVQRAMDTWLRMHPELDEVVTGRTEKDRQLYHISELEGMDFERRDLVEGYIPSGKLVQVFGAPGSGKTFLLADIALSVAQFGTVIYVAAEDFEDIPIRFAAWKAHHNRDYGNVYVWKDPVQLFEPDSVSHFLTSIAPLDPTLIIIDPLANCAVGHDIDRTQDMTQAVDVLNRIRVQSESTVVVCHHTGWGDTHERGSSVLRGACRVVFKISERDKRITLSCEKINGGMKPEARYFALMSKEDSAVIIPTSKMHQGDELSPKQEDVLIALAQPIFRDGATNSDLAEHTSIPKSTVSEALNKLLKRQLVVKNKRNFTITDEGKAYLVNELGNETNATAPQVTNDLNWQVNRIP